MEIMQQVKVNQKVWDIMETGKMSEVKMWSLHLLTLHRGMEHGSANVIAVTFAGSPMLELDTNSSLANPLHT